MNKIVRIVAVGLLSLSALLPALAITQHAFQSANPTQLAGGTPPPCNPRMELCIPLF